MPSLFSREEKSITISSLYLRLALVALCAIAGSSLSGCDATHETTASADQSRKEISERSGVLSQTSLPQSGCTLPSGTNLSVRLLQTISSQSARPGDEFDAELSSSVHGDGRIGFPRGARVRGKVVDCHPSGRLTDPGYLRLTLEAIRTTDGKWLNIRTTLVSGKGASHAKRNATIIAGGAGLGALVGGLAGGVRGTGIGAAAGAGTGTAGAYATGRKDIIFPAERKLVFATTQEIRLEY